eukprot:1358055-Amphidinium_carterae.1
MRQNGLNGPCKKAKAQHLRFVSSNPSEQMVLEKKYVFGRSSPIPRPEHVLESLARCEVLDVLPPWLKTKINTARAHTTKDIVWFTLKVLQPSPDFLRIGICRELMAKSAALTSYARMFHTKLEVTVEVKVRVEPQEVLQHLVNT